MDLKQLEYFVRVAELGSFTKASNLLDIAQPALSRQIRLLETELRQNLLIRNGRGVAVTDAGKVLLEHGRGILHQVDRAKEDVSMVRGTLAGRVALGLPPSMAKIINLPLTREFRKMMPDAKLSIIEGLSVAMQESLLAGRLDIALLYNPGFTSDIETIPIFDEDLYFVSPKSKNSSKSAIELEELAQLPLVMPGRPNALRMLLETELNKIGKKPNIALEIDGVMMILDLIEDSAGHGILPQYTINASGRKEQFDVRRINNLTGKLVLATAANRASTRTQLEAIRIIQSIVGKKPA